MDAAAIEAILFVSVEPISTAELAKLTDTSEKTVEKSLTQLKNDLRGRGINLVSNDNKHQLVSSPRFSKLASPLIEQASPALSPSALEVLAIIAHRQPISRSDIEQLRGVSSEQTIKNLLAKDLIAISKKKRRPTEPLSYITTMEFLRQAGLGNISELTPVEDRNDR